ncbi:DUF1308 domain-containing protein [Nostoc sp. FACHB-973]|nr:DUF1308 domain-containing protein [Nostoc sp. FACHB-973]
MGLTSPNKYKLWINNSCDTFTESHLTPPDNPSTVALNLQPTRSLGRNDIIILGTGDRLGILTMTADAKAVRAALSQGVKFNVYIHVPCPLTGN